MIYYNLNTINDWNFGDDNIIKVYKHGAVCYYKITSGDTPTPVQEPCFAVVDDITQYSDREYEDVYDKETEKWFKLNNLNQYEEYGIYTSGRTICSAVSFTELTGIIAQSTTALTNHNITVTPAVGAFSKIRIDTTKSATTASYCWAAFTPTPSGSEVLGFNMSSIGAMNGYGNNKNYVTDANGSQTFAHWVDDNNTIVEIDIAALSNNQASELYLLFYQENCKPAAFSFNIESTDCVTTYEGKLTIDDGYEYQYSGGSWVNVGEVSGGTIETVWLDYPSNNNVNAKFNIGHYWGENYKMVFRAYISGSYSSDRGSFWIYDLHTPIEFSFYSNGFYYDFHNPTSTSSPSVSTGDYSWRIMKNGSLRSYENSQILDFTLTNGTVEVKLEETGVAVVTGSTRVTAQNWYNGLYQASIGIMNSYNRCHLSSIKIYNGNDELVNDLKFVKNQGVTGSQEISLYDSVLNVTYNNTNSNTPTYHIVKESGGTTYPIYYDEIQDPPDYLEFSSMAEAEAYECPWVGMHAIINGDKYVFSGDSQSGYEWVYNPSRLPVGYTEVEYVENTGTSYFNTNFKPNTNTRIVADMQQVTANDYPRLFGCNNWNDTAGMNVDYEGGYLQISWFGKTSWSTITSIPNNFDRHVYDLNKNNLYVDETLVASTTYSSSYQSSDNLGIFFEMSNGRPGQAAYFTQEAFKGKMYSFQIYDNGTLVRDLVPCKRDNDNTVGAYDIVNDVFYTVPTGYTTDKLVAGDPVI